MYLKSRFILYLDLCPIHKACHTHTRASRAEHVAAPVDFLPRVHKALGSVPSTCNPGNGDRGPEVQGHPQLFHEFKKSGGNRQESKNSTV